MSTTPSLIRTIEQVSGVYNRQGDGRVELDRMIAMLDEYEINIAIDYLSNLLLSRAKPHDSDRRYGHCTR